MITRPTKETRVETPEKIDTRIGLCATCMWGDGCVNVGTPERPTYYCEEFETETAADIKADPRYAPHSSRKGNGKESAKFQGLCKDCAHREGCVHTSPGGTWHCEMYE